jgi:hypothetical protein
MAKEFGVISNYNQSPTVDFTVSVRWNSNFDDDNVLVRWVRTCPPNTKIPITQEIVDHYHGLLLKWIRDDATSEFCYDFYTYNSWWQLGVHLQDSCYDGSENYLYYWP